jgi:hypothetical protein
MRGFTTTEGVLALLVVGLAIALVARDATSLGGPGQDEASVERGRQLVTSMGCVDCHAPKTLGPNGPEVDPTRLLSGHPAEPGVPPPPATDSQVWSVVATWDLTAWSGPWGITYGRNLTPDQETGIGAWSEQQFVDTLKRGRQLGVGRPVLPPMPVEPFSHVSEADMRSMYRYLMTLPPIRNQVPEPVLAGPPPSPTP